MNTIGRFLTMIALVRVVEWEIWENEVNVAYNPKCFPLFSYLWIWYAFGHEAAKQIKNTGTCEAT